MSVLKVASMGHPVLRKKAEPVAKEMFGTEELKDFVADMVDTMDEYDGRGLAAPQVHESLQIVVMLWDFDKDKEAYVLTLINPKITHLTQEKDTHWEGCLSVPGLIGKVSRPNRIKVEAFDEDGKNISFIAEGFAATVVQHECDHLDGVLYVDRIEDIVNGFSFTKEFQRHHTSQD